MLNQIENGERFASEELLPLVYNELCRLAKKRITNENLVKHVKRPH